MEVLYCSARGLDKVFPDRPVQYCFNTVPVATWTLGVMMNEVDGSGTGGGGGGG